MGRDLDSIEWNNFRMDWLGLMIRIEAGELRLTHNDVRLLKHANEYLIAMDMEADVPDIVRIHREKQMP